MTEPFNLPPTFVKQGDHIVSPDHGDWFRVWTVKPCKVALELSSRQFREMATGSVFATPRMSRQGWNVRKTFPKAETLRGLPFLFMDDEGKVWSFYNRGATMRKAS